MTTRLPYASALLLVASLLAASPAAAQYRGGWGRPGNGAYDIERDARANGYREGYNAGLRDANARRRFDCERDSVYRRGDIGYSGYGDRGDYRQFFRVAFEAGYREGYNGRSGYGYGADGRYSPGYDTRGWGQPRSDRSYGGYYSPARQKGFEDGREKGYDDGRHDHRFDPVGEKWYREGDRGYKREFGPRDVYKNTYRDAFRAGYEQGYREARGGDYGRRW